MHSNDQTKLQSLNLKALKIIHTLVMTGSVTRSANLLHVSPGMISYELKKLRRITGAHLFNRTRTGMRPDTTAQELDQRYRFFMAMQTKRSGAVQSDFPIRLTLNADSPVEVLLSGSPKANQASCTPDLVFAANQEEGQNRLEQLMRGEVDLDIGSSLPVDSQISKLRLFSSSGAMLVGRTAFPGRENFTLEDWHQSQHISWSLDTDFYSRSFGKLYETQRHMRNRDTTITSFNMFNLAALCASGNVVAVIPHFYAPALTARFAVRALSLPTELDICYDGYLHFSNRLAEMPGMTNVLSALVSRIREAGAPSVADCLYPP